MRFLGEGPDWRAERLKWFATQYGVDAPIGKRVRFDGALGIIVDYSGPYLLVRLEEGRAGIKKGRIINCHPTWHMEYLS